MLKLMEGIHISDSVISLKGAKQDYKSRLRGHEIG